MKTKNQLLILFLFFFSTVSAQINFEPGYIIDNSGQKKQCLIKNKEWESNPSIVEYKWDENSEVIIATVKDIQSFRVNDRMPYVSAHVNIDQSSDNLNRLDNFKAPNFKKEELFLQVLIQGEYSLYYSYKDGLRRYYFNVKDQPIQQLVYKRYKKPETINVKTNKQFISQLWKNIRCEKNSANNIDKLEYTRKSIVAYFKNFYACSGKDYIDYSAKIKKSKLRIKITPGIELTTFKIEGGFLNRKYDFESKLSYRVGAEFELILPFLKNKWAVVFEPTFQIYKNKKEFENRQVGDIEYKSIDFTGGVRHYFYLNDEHSIFVNALLKTNFSIHLDTVLDFEPRSDFDISTGNSLVAGLGYDYNRLSIEFRYNFNRNLINQYLSWSSDFKKASIIFGFKIIQ